MSWTSWASLLFPTFLIAHTVLAWSFTQPKSAGLRLIAPILLLLCIVALPTLSGDSATSVYLLSLKTVAILFLDLVGANHANMLLTGAAVVWLARRAWQTLWKPVPELINILGVDVPDPPDVSLAGIRSDAATVHWSRYPANRPVEKFLIQVNGVVVGEVASNQESAIVVSGLKPNHFYNVRVIAVGHNNFQAGSRVIRLRTFANDGRPELGNSRTPSNFQTDDHPHGPSGGDPDDHPGGRGSIPIIENAASPEPLPSPARDGSLAAGVGPRRNTVTRRHSPSMTSLDQPSIREEPSGATEKSLPELTERFESIRKETEETASLVGKEDSENKRLLDDLETEKLEKRGEQKKKEEQTEKLKREVNATDRLMRDTMQRRAQKEKALKEKQKERAKYADNLNKWGKDMDKMRAEQQNFVQQKKDLEKERATKAACLQEANADLQGDCSRLEAELKEKRDQVKELEDERKRLPGGADDSEWIDKEAELRREWQARQRELQEALLLEQKQYRLHEDQLRVLNLQINHIPQANNLGPFTRANPSGLDFDNSAVNQFKRRSRTINSQSNDSISSPLPAYSQIDPRLSVPTGFGTSRAINAPPGFAPGPYMDLSADIPARMDEAGIRAMMAPLSPSATALLPSSILDDIDDDESPTTRYDPESFMAIPMSGSPDNDPESPASSRWSPSILSSPQVSSQNLPLPIGHEVADRRGTNAPTSPPITEAPSLNRLGSLFMFPRSNRPKAEGEEGGPALGSLKHGQSQSLPRQIDDIEPYANKRRISLSGTWSMFHRNTAPPDVIENHGPGSRMFSARNLNPFSHSPRGAGGIFSGRDPSSPRPASIASSDFPRPSTDSSSIWGPPPPVDPLASKQSFIWSPEAAGGWSRSASRRPSLHGSPSALKTTLASADDEILDDETLQNVSDVGVIGSRLPASSKGLGRLNPAAPAFMGSLFSGKSRSDRDKERERDGGKEKDKKSKDKSKDKARETKDKAKSRELSATSPDTPGAPSIEADYALDSRRSKDGYSIDTQTSRTESRESLSLDMSFSNTTSDSTSTGLGAGAKDENVVRKLFRKGSSGKFSLPGRLGGKESSLFKKGPSSTASAGASERGFGTSSLERTSIGDFEEVLDEGGRSHDGVTSSPSIGGMSAKSAKDPKAPVRWLSTFKKGRKEKESLDLDREAAENSFVEPV